MPTDNTTVTTAGVTAPVAGDINRKETPSVYNPRDRSFIKAPEEKICPHCGQKMQPEVTPMKNHMNQYVNANGVVIVFNDNANVIKLKDVEFYKVTGTDNAGKPVSAFAPAKTVPTK